MVIALDRIRRTGSLARCLGLALGLIAPVAGGPSVSRGECPPPVTPDGPGWPNQRIDPAPYSLSIESGSGAVGDVVGVSVVLESRIPSSNGFFMMMPVCHDPEVAELVGKPFYTDEFLSLLGPAGVQQIKVIEGSTLPGDPRGHG